MPLLTMLQEIQFKLMTRMRQKRDDMLASDLQICPKIKKYLDVLITESRKWNAAWDGERKFQVKQGTRCVTVDLERGNCDCRVYDLTGMPCQHAIAAIHSRRHNPTDYVSDYYKREKYLAAYKHSLEAMKGEEYWDFHGGEIMLPPDIPKRLRGRPKKLRRREAWEGGSRSQTAPSQGVLLQRFSNKRVMHCSNCGDASHRLAKCPTMGKDSATTPTEATKKNETPTGAKRKATKEVRRQKLKPRKAQPGIVIREPEEGGKPQTQASQTGPVKDKGKAVEEEVPQSVWDILEEQGEDPTEEQGGEERLSFFTKIPKKKMPLMRGQETDEWEKSGKNYADFQEQLRGPTGYKAVFMPTPGHRRFQPPLSQQGGTPPVSTPPVNLQGGEPPLSTPPLSRTSSTSAPSRKSTRLMYKQSFKFKNTSDDPVEL